MNCFGFASLETGVLALCEIQSITCRFSLFRAFEKLEVVKSWIEEIG